MTPRRNQSRLLLALALATATALVWSDMAAAQQSQPPTELWEEYPLDLEGDSRQPPNGGQQDSDPGTDGAPAVGDAPGEAAAAAGERIPVPIFVALAALVFFLVLGLGIWANVRHPAGSGLPRRLSPEPRARSGRKRSPATDTSRSVRLRDRIGAARSPSPRPGAPSRKERAGPPGQASDPRNPPVVPASRQEEPERVAEPAPESGDPGGPDDKPKEPPAPKTPPAPKARTAVKRKRPAQKPRPTRPVQAAKPPKPAPPAKPAQSVKPSQPPKAARPPEHAAPKKPVPAPPPRHEPATRNEVPTQQGLRRKPPRVDDAHTGSEKMLTCSILWRRNGSVSDFYALSTGLRGHVFVVDRSPEFEWLGGDIPREAREAHAELVYSLVRDGWRPLGSKGPWYRQRFERPVGGSRPRTSER